MILVATASASEPAGSAEVRTFSINVSAESFARPAPVEIFIGPARAGTVVSFRLSFHQSADGPVTIGKLVPSCPCIESTVPLHPIARGETGTVGVEWYVGPAHGDRSVSISVPLRGEQGKVSSLTLLARAAVTDLISMDHHARFVDVGPIDVRDLTKAPTAISTFQKTKFRAWEKVRVTRSSGLMPLRLSEPSQGAFELAAIPSQIGDSNHLQLGVFSEEVLLGFTNAGSDLPETVAYRVNAKFTDDRFRLVPDQLFAGLQSKSNRPANDVGTVQVRGFRANSVTHRRTVYDYNGVATSKEASPFTVAITNTSSVPGEGSLAITLADADAFDRTTLRQCDKACSYFTILGAAPDGTAVSFNLPVYFTVEP